MYIYKWINKLNKKIFNYAGFNRGINFILMNLIMPRSVSRASSKNSVNDVLASIKKFFIFFLFLFSQYIKNTYLLQIIVLVVPVTRAKEKQIHNCWNSWVDVYVHIDRCSSSCYIFRKYFSFSNKCHSVNGNSTNLATTCL